jgi:hypothetical protein
MDRNTGATQFNIKDGSNVRQVCGLNTLKIIIIIIIIIKQVLAISFRGKYPDSKDTNTKKFLVTCN